jgi:hypothetical protein
MEPLVTDGESSTPSPSEDAIVEKDDSRTPSEVPAHTPDSV